MVIKTKSVSFCGINTITVDIETDIQVKVKNFEIVGMAGTIIKESVKRVESAILNCGYSFPGKRITVNLAPAGIKKDGTLFDLPIALSILSDYYEFRNLSEYLIIGELALDGSVRPIPGAILVAIHAKENGFNKIICPEKNVREMSIIRGIDIYPVDRLDDAVMFLNNEKNIEKIENLNFNDYLKNSEKNYPDMGDIRGQDQVKRALEICAAGGHNALMIGPPGSGKSMLASRIPSILPPMSLSEAIETTKIYSVAGLTSKESPIITNRPFRSPHHTSSDIAIIGGGKNPHPGEVSLAHNGVLFLDEIQLFKTNVLQVLREPMETGKICISRAEGYAEYPADFILIAALNPSKRSTDINNSRESDIQNIIEKLSGPLFDRIDFHINVPKLDYKKIKNVNSEPSDIIKERVIRTRYIQKKRLAKFNILTNSKMNLKMIEEFCVLDHKAELLLKMAMERFMLSIRSYTKILKCARTIADLDNSNIIKDHHIAEVLQYRVLDKFLTLNV